MKNILLTLLLILSMSTSVLAQEDGDRIYIKMGEAKVKKSLIAVPAFLFLSSPSLAPSYKQVGTELFNTVVNDLEISNLFTIIKQDAYLEDVAKVGLTPAPGNPTGFHFDLWTKINAEFLVRGGFKIDGATVEFEVYVYYVPQAKLVLGKKYVAKLSEVRQTAHTFADDLMKALTGKQGIFRTKFVVGSDRAGKNWREIYVMDWDGRNITAVTSHHSVSLSPAWSPDAKTISYTSFAYHPKLKIRNPDLFTYDIFTGKRYLVSSRLGINSGSTFTPDGQSIFLTISKGSDPDIYKMSLDGDDITRVTNGPRGALNVEPSVTPDGKKIAFSSDRTGNPMIYLMDTNGTNTKRITFAGHYNSSPSVSPDGKRLAFAGRDKGHFDIFTVNIDGTDMQRLTSAKKPDGRGADNEDPSYSPDGRHIVFTSNRTGKSQIYITSVDGTNERRITVDNHNYFKARWSPYIK
ncbi:MAG: translocation protein TolB [Oligoflexia bacterium]|nr:translocation protein TolB [Oligoflexia bacterium]